MNLEIWIAIPPGGTEFDPPSSTVYIVQGTGNLQGFDNSDYGVLGSHNTVANTGVTYDLFDIAGAYFSIPLFSSAFGWFVSGQPFNLGVRVKGDVDSVVPTGSNDLEVFEKWQNAGAVQNSSLTITYALQSGNAIKKKLFVSGLI
jgi:hypothetical protein